MNKVLVCITPQANGKRLIKKANEKVLDLKGELHILHVVKGNNIFLTEESPKLLEELYGFGAELGGVLHGICGEDIPKTILKFIIDEKITHVVVGTPPQNTNVKSEDVYVTLKSELPELDILVLEPESI